MTRTRTPHRVDDMLDRARTIAANAEAENRGFTDAERAEVSDLIARAKRAKAATQGSRDLLDSLDDLGLTAAVETPSTNHRRTPSPLNGVVSSVIDRLRTRGDGSIRAAFSTAGEIVVPADLFGTIQAKPKAYSFIGQLLGDAKPLEPGDWSYLRQVLRTNNAAPVAIGETKPTSVYTLERVSDPVTTIAHLSDPIPRQHLEDVDDLEKFIGSEMLLGLLAAIDEQIWAGDGTEPNLEGILTATGVQSQPFDTSALVSARKALTRLQTAEIVADTSDTTDLAYVIAPADWEALELTRTTTEEFTMGGPINSAARTLWGVPVVVANTAAPGTALLGKFTEETIRLGNRGGVRLAWSEAVSDDFERNYVRARCEGRFGLAIAQPSAFVVIDTSAA